MRAQPRSQISLIVVVLICGLYSLMFIHFKGRIDKVEDEISTQMREFRGSVDASQKQNPTKDVTDLRSETYKSVSELGRDLDNINQQLAKLSSIETSLIALQNNQDQMKEIKNTIKDLENQVDVLRKAMELPQSKKSELDLPTSDSAYDPSWKPEPKCYPITFAYNGLEVWDIFRRGSTLMFISPDSASKGLDQLQCVFSDQSTTNVEVMRNLRSDPHIVYISKCDIPGSILSGLPIEDWSIKLEIKQGDNSVKKDLAVCPQPFDQDQHYVSMCTIFKNESIYFREWIEYHMMMGLEHFYLYDHNSSDDFFASLKPYIINGIVTYIPFNHEKPQLHALNHCLWKYGQYNTWLEFNDIDEFIFPQGANKNLVTVLDKYVHREDVASIGINPHNFGTSGHDRRPKGLVIDNYTSRGPELTPSRSKMIVKTANVEMVAVHYPTNVKKGQKIVADKDELTFNHYFTKSLEDWEIRCKKGTANGWFVVEPPYLPANPTHAEVPDTSIKDKFSAALAKRMSVPHSVVQKPERHIPKEIK